MSTCTKQQTEVAQLYIALFDRAADGGGLVYWANKMNGGVPLEEIAQDFYISDEGRDIYGSDPGSGQFAEKVQKIMPGGDGDRASVDKWAAQIGEQGKTQGAVTVEMIKALLSDPRQDPDVAASQTLFKAQVAASIDVIKIAQQTEISQLYVALFNRAPDSGGLVYWVNALNDGVSLEKIAQDFYISNEGHDIYGGDLGSQQFIKKIHKIMPGGSGNKAGVDKWAAQIDIQGKTQGAVMVEMINALLSDVRQDPDVAATQTLFKAQVAASVEYAIAGNTAEEAHAVLERVAEQIDIDRINGGKIVEPVIQPVVAPPDQGNNIDPVRPVNPLEKFKGTDNDDTFIIKDRAEKTALMKGGIIDGKNGNNTVVLSLDGTESGIALTGLSNIQNLQVKGALPTAGSLDVSGIGDLKNLELDAPDIAENDDIGIIIGDGQVIKLSNISDDFYFNIAGDSATGSNVTLNDVSGEIALFIDGMGMKVLQLNATGSEIDVVLANRCAALEKLILTGDKHIAIRDSGHINNSITSVDASQTTAGVRIDLMIEAEQAAFTFIGGTGNDAVILLEGDLKKLTMGSQLNGGGGKNMLSIGDETFDDAIYARLNSLKNFHTLDLSGGDVAIDASRLTAFEDFSTTSDNLHINGVKDIKVTFLDHNDEVFLEALEGVSDTKSLVILGNDASDEIAIDKLRSDNVLTLVSNGNDAQFGNTISALYNLADTIVSVSGSADLEFTLMNPGVVDAKKFTGDLTVKSSGFDNEITGGCGDDEFTVQTASDNATTVTLTGGDGRDTFDVSVAKAGDGATAVQFSKTEITDFSIGDGIRFGKNARFEKTAIEFEQDDTVASMLNKAVTSSGSADGLVRWFTLGGDAYLVNDLSARERMNSEVVVVKLIGVS